MDIMRAHLTLGSLLVAAALLLAACGETETDVSPQAGAGTPPADGPAGAFETIEVGDQSGFDFADAQVFKIENQSEWEEFWSQHKENQIPPPPPPPVDFSREMVVAVVDRIEPSGGYGFGITDIEEIDGALFVSATRGIPAAECVVADVITQPFHIVRMAKSDEEPELAISKETRTCASP